jgi:hypothetical protein
MAGQQCFKYANKLNLRIAPLRGKQFIAKAFLNPISLVGEIGRLVSGFLVNTSVASAALGLITLGHPIKRKMIRLKMESA